MLLLQGTPDRAVAQPRDRVQTRTFGSGYELPSLFGTRVHAGLLIGLVLVAVTTVVLLATLGVRLRAPGQSPAAAEFSGCRSACCSGGALWSPARWRGSAGRRR